MTRTPRTLKGFAGFFGFAVPSGSERVHELAVDLDLDNAAVLGGAGPELVQAAAGAECRRGWQAQHLAVEASFGSGFGPVLAAAPVELEAAPEHRRRTAMATAAAAAAAQQRVAAAAVDQTDTRAELLVQLDEQIAALDLKIRQLQSGGTAKMLSGHLLKAAELGAERKKLADERNRLAGGGPAPRRPEPPRPEQNRPRGPRH